jgi:hypothetical protein
LGSTCTSKIFLLKLGLLTFFSFSYLFWLDFVVERVQISKKDGQVSSRNKNLGLRQINVFAKNEKIYYSNSQTATSVKIRNNEHLK